MNNSTIGVGIDLDTRSSRDLNVLKTFSCSRPDNLKYRGSNRDDTIGVNSAPDGRSQRDMQMISDFSCTRENFTLKAGKMEPRSDRDMQMLKEFNSTCQEDFQYRGHYDQRAKVMSRNSSSLGSLNSENYCALCGPSCPCNPNCPGGRYCMCPNCPRRRMASSENYCALCGPSCPCNPNCPGGRYCMCPNCPRRRMAMASYEGYCGGGGPNCPANQGLANLNFNPYNSSSDITYVGLN